MKFVPNALTKKVAMTVLKSKKNSPTIMFVGGIVGVTTAAVLACRATLKLEEVIEGVHDNLDLANNMKHDDYSEDDRDKDKTYIVIKGVYGVAKLYAPAVVIGIVSIGMLTGSHRALTKQNVALTAAYAALEKGFNEYRERVLADVGIEKEREYRYPLEDRVVEIDGKKKTIKAISEAGMSMYARAFGPDSPSWSVTPEYNIVFLRLQQNYANDRLRARGHVFLNEVYDMLGIERSTAGAVVGWFFEDEKDYIDFGIFNNPDDPFVHDYVSGHEGLIWMDFNVDGVIYEKI